MTVRQGLLIDRFATDGNHDNGRSSGVDVRDANHLLPGWLIQSKAAS